jgi:hypothetical protein
LLFSSTFFLSQTLYQRLHILWQLRFELHLLSVNRVTKSKTMCVERLTAE